ncbi:MAG TPA: Wzz/FepE/Etk N-terminal domain-containing protein [Thermomicrobiales bacterium]
MPTNDQTFDSNGARNGAHDSDHTGGPQETDEDLRPTGPDPYLAFALRWWWLIVLGAVIGIGGAFAYTAYGPIPYQSVAQVQVPPQTTTNPNASANQSITATTNYTAEAATSQIFSLVSKELSSTLPLSASDLTLLQQEGKIDIRATKGTNFIVITVTDTDQGKARLLADTIATVFVRDVNARASAQIDARQQLLEGQIDQTGQRYLTSRLNQRQEELQASLTTQRASLLQLQASYQQELQRQAEADRLSGTNGPPSPQIVATRAQWLDTINNQISQVQNTLRDTTIQIDDVRAQLVKLPGSADPSVSAAFASAYGQQLQTLTRDYAQLQLDAPAARVPLIRYGVASDPLPATGKKKILIAGAGLGLALAAALGFGLDMLRRRRQQRAITAFAEAEVATAPAISAVPPTPLPLRETAAPAAPERDLLPLSPVASVAERQPDDILSLVERARQRRETATGYRNGQNGTASHTNAAIPRSRPLPTQDDEPPLRKAE